MADRIVRWFDGASRPRIGYALIAAVAAGYSLVAFELALAGARPMPQPYLRIGDAEYFAWAALFYAPVIVGAWLLASAVMAVAGLALRLRGSFEKLLPATAFAAGLGTLSTLLPDLVTSPLRMAGVIDEASWERSIAEFGGWFWFTWVTLVVYIGIFAVAFPLAVRHALRAPWSIAVPLGLAGFAVFQGFEYLFIR